MRARGLRIAVVVGLLVAAVPIGLTATAGGLGTPGADGVGDSYFPLAGNGGYHVGHYRLDIRYSPGTDVLVGRTTISATATQALSRFDLDLIGLRVRSITVDDDDATWEREGQELIVHPASSIANNAEFEVVVRYRGIPRSPLSYGARAGAIRTDDGVLIYGEPDVAAYWYPSNDHPRDKATFEINLTVPPGLKAISNGRLMGREDAGNGRVTWSWLEDDPMATYLAMAVIGRFQIERSQTSDGIRVLHAFDPRVGRNARRSIGKSVRVLRFLEDRFGPYPFDDLGGIVDTAGEFALENQTRPIYPAGDFDQGQNVPLVVHELAHQWFGDSVSLHDWSHIWLNEGFASYAEWLWFGKTGQASPQSILRDLCGIPAGRPFWSVTPDDPGVDNLFAGAVYVRGAMTLQALRKTVGTADFFEIIATWLNDHADSTATTNDLITIAEQVSGQELSAFFDEWLSTSEKPSPCVVTG
jgi:aminopeptidase N